MGRFVAWILALAITLGAPGLFIVAFLDSSILSLPEIADLLVIYMVVHRKGAFVLYAATATVGSLAGCVSLYLLAKKGGEALIKKRFTSTTVEQTLARFRRHGVMTVLIPALLPPPAPFKIFVLLAGAGGISLARFSAALAIGRGLRFLAIAVLALRYGDRAIPYLHAHGTAASLVTAGVLALGLVAWIVWSKVRAANRR